MDETYWYERGRLDGQWTPEALVAGGWASAAICLATVEQTYQEEMSRLPALRATHPAYAARHAAYIEGQIQGARETLHALMSQGGER